MRPFARSDAECIRRPVAAAPLIAAADSTAAEFKWISASTLRARWLLGHSHFCV